MPAAIATDVLAFLGSLFFGALGAFGYVSRRFPGQAWSVSKSGPGRMYLLVHALVSAVAYLIILLFDWTFLDTASTPGQVAFTRAVVAGFGALAFMRTRVAFPVAGGDASIGPGESIDSILSELERQVVERQATGHVQLVLRELSDLTYAAIGNGVLASICLRIIQETQLAESVSKEQLDSLEEDLAALDDPDNSMPNEVRRLLLGLALVGVFGEAVFESGVKGLKSART